MDKPPLHQLSDPSDTPDGFTRLPRLYRRSLKMAQRGNHEQAWLMLDRQLNSSPDPTLKALLLNDLAALEAIEGKIDEAERRLRDALDLDLVGRQSSFDWWREVLF